MLYCCLLITLQVLILIFWLSSALVFHSYVLFPLTLRLRARGLKRNIPVSELKPRVDILMAVHNSAEILEEKVRSVFESDYPAHLMRFYIGSDCSTDDTNEILSTLQSRYPNLEVTIFNERTGKIGIINTLFEKAKDGASQERIVISTDATAIFHPSCVANLVRHFSDNTIGAVGANIIKEKSRADGISKQEKAYYYRELMMKYEEGLIWGTSIGVFGACYAIRPDDFTKVPAQFIVDDFYITMCMLERGRKVIYDMDACVSMNLANESSVEFRRKVRIATGNFQNLARFYKVLFRMDGLAYAFFSHKVLRWLGPFLLLLSLTSSVILRNESLVYFAAAYTQVVLFLFPLFNYGLERMNLHHKLIKFIAHFYLMNFGILVGFFRYIRGVKSSVWEPTRRF